jgi:hypothetical protein
MPETVASCLYALTTGDPEKVIATWKSDMTGSRRLAVAQFAKAQKGDTAASKAIADTVARYQRQSATDTRAPNRKPRVRTITRIKLCSVRKQLFCDSLRAGRTEQEASDDISVTIERLRDWRKHDADFAAAWAGAQKYRNDVVSGILQGSLTRAAEVMVETLNFQNYEELTQAARLRKDAALALLKGHGLLVEKTGVEVTGKDGGAIQTEQVQSLQLDPETTAGALKALTEAGVTIGNAPVNVCPN